MAALKNYYTYYAWIRWSTLSGEVGGTLAEFSAKGDKEALTRAEEFKQFCTQTVSGSSNHVVDRVFEPGREIHRRVLKFGGILGKPVESLAFPARVHNCIKNAREGGIELKTVRDLVLVTEETWLRRVKNFGRKSLHDLKEELERHGLKPGMTEEELMA